MSRFLSRRPFGSGRAATDTHLTPRSRPFAEDAALTPGASALDEEGQRYFSDGNAWRADLPAGSEVMVPPWQSVPPGWAEIGDVAGLPPGRKLITNRYSVNYTLNNVLSWVIIQPSNLYTDAARTTPVTTPPAPVGGIDDVGYSGNHWVQTVSADRPTWDTYTRDGETISGLTSETISKKITVPLGGATTGSVLIFFQNSAFYAPADFGGNDVSLISNGFPVEEMMFLDRVLTASELEALVELVRRERNRQPLDSFAANGTTNYTGLFFVFSFITEIPVFDTSGGEVFAHMFGRMVKLQTLPALDFSSATDINYMCRECTGLTDIGTPDFGEVIMAQYSFWRTAITTFNIDLPKAEDVTGLLLGSDTVNVKSINLSMTQAIPRICELCASLTSFGFGGQSTTTFPSLQGTWNSDPSNPAQNGAMRAFCNAVLLTDLPAGMFDSAACTNYFEFATGAALSQTSVDNVLVSIAQSLTNDATLTDGYLSLDGGTNATPSSAGQAAADQLRNAGWTVDLNGY